MEHLSASVTGIPSRSQLVLWRWPWPQREGQGQKLRFSKCTAQCCWWSSPSHHLQNKYKHVILLVIFTMGIVNNKSLQDTFWPFELFSFTTDMVGMYCPKISGLRISHVCTKTTLFLLGTLQTSSLVIRGHIGKKNTCTLKNYTISYSICSLHHMKYTGQRKWYHAREKLE